MVNIKVTSRLIDGEETAVQAPKESQSAIAAWRARLGLSQRAAAAALGITFQAYQQRERGTYPDGRPLRDSRLFLLACAAVENAVAPIE
ncbi:helix-turn-helix domain-containing protein [Xanthomonas perforans]|uniref:helix-turn-helix domain-containing protein n=1 Tax=Xanthomonas perforans TaxID=442694 RepID=UPI002359BD27|nr:helix-turn-helix transcriptional regulator [Xanthomonas perforans]MDC9654357.1 helix-turn-helix transcriptional regulator [Xanthomonas perforans]